MGPCTGLRRVLVHEPDDGSKSCPVRSFSRVLLPAPFGPRRPNISPFPTVNNVAYGHRPRTSWRASPSAMIDPAMLGPPIDQGTIWCYSSFRHGDPSRDYRCRPVRNGHLGLSSIYNTFRDDLRVRSGADPIQADHDRCVRLDGGGLNLVRLFRLFACGPIGSALPPFCSLLLR